MLGHQFLRVVMLVTCYVTQTADSDMELSLCLSLLEPNQAFYRVKAKPENTASIVHDLNIYISRSVETRKLHLIYDGHKCQVMLFIRISA